MLPIKHTLLLLLVLLATAPATAQLLSEQKSYDRGDTLRGSLNENRTWFDVVHYHLDIFVDPETKTIGGHNDITFEVLEPHGTMQIDLFDNLKIDGISLNGEALDYTREFNAVMIDVPELETGTEQTLRFAYSGTPIEAKRAPWDGGMVWAQDNNGKPWIGVACEGLGASAWWPNKDHLSDEPDRGVTLSVAVPKGLVYVGNGNLKGKETDEENDRTRWTWEVTYPINNYNVTLNIGDYVHFGDTYQDPNSGDTLALDYYVMPYNVEIAKKQFEQVKPMLDCFDKYLGPYPFWRDGYALVETPYLGMEHQGAIAYGNGYKPGYAGNTKFTGGHEFDYIIIHETAHEWWGNSISAKDIADLWIHESICTYSEGIYVECLHGYEAAIEYVNNSRPHLRNDRPIIGPYGVNEEGSGDMYSKGALIFNTFRHVLGDDDKWWAFIYGLANDFKHQTVDAQTVLNYLNEQTGIDYSRMFDQYFNHAELPVLEYRLAKKGRNKTELSYRWVADVEGFDLPVRYRDDKGDWQTLRPTADWQTTTVKARPTNLAWDEDRFLGSYEEVVEE